MRFTSIFSVRIASFFTALVLPLGLALAAAGLASACSSTPSTTPASGVPDAGVVADAAPGPTADADVADDGGVDAAEDPQDILGTLSGSCGVLGPMLHATAPSLVDNGLTFVAGEHYAADTLSADGQKMYAQPNAGGTSVESEVMSLEVLHYCEDASLLATETQVRYSADAGSGSITDILVSIGGERYGVSVTRAYKPSPGMTDDQVKELLETKLRGIQSSTARVDARDRWVKQILHVFVIGQAGVEGVKRVWPTIADADKVDTIVLVTATTGGGFIYCHTPPLGSECTL